MTKNALRQTIRSLQRLITKDDRKEADGIITRRMLDVPEWENAGVVCLYMSGPYEVDTSNLLTDLLNHHVTVVLPRVEGRNLVLHTITSIKDLVRGSYDILEPKKTCKIISTSSMDLCIIPGVAFDRRGNRLGHGKGYYDKLLQNVTVPKIGLAYAFQVLAEVPCSSYDVPVTMVVTEKEVLNFR